MKEVIPLLTGTILAIVQSTMLFPGTFFAPVILCVFAMGVYMLETAKKKEEKFLSFSDISMFSSKEEYIRSFQPDYVPASAATASAASGVTSEAIVAVIGAAVALASFIAPVFTVVLNAGMAVYFFSVKAKDKELGLLRPTFGMAFFIVTFGILAWQSSPALGGVLPLAVFFLKTLK